MNVVPFRRPYNPIRHYLRSLWLVRFNPRGLLELRESILLCVFLGKWTEASSCLQVGYPFLISRVWRLKSAFFKNVLYLFYRQLCVFCFCLCFFCTAVPSIVAISTTLVLIVSDSPTFLSKVAANASLYNCPFLIQTKRIFFFHTSSYVQELTAAVVSRWVNGDTS